MLFRSRLGRNQLGRVENFIARRRAVDGWLDEELSSVPRLRLLQSSAASRHNGLYYGVLADRAAELREFLFRRGIDSETSEYLNCADLEMYSARRVDCPVAREVQLSILRLPNYPSLSRRHVHRIGDAVRAFYAASGR